MICSWKHQLRSCEREQRQEQLGNHAAVSFLMKEYFGILQDAIRADPQNAHTQRNLSCMHLNLNGQGATQGAEQAARWPQKAADQGFAEAQLALRSSLKECQSSLVRIFRVSSKMQHADYDGGRRQQTRGVLWRSATSAACTTTATLPREMQHEQHNGGKSRQVRGTSKRTSRLGGICSDGDGVRKDLCRSSTMAA
jgi:TPR repeat protein